MKILFVGNSHTYMNDMPEIVRINASRSLEVFMLARGGITFRDHLNDPSFHFAIKQDYDIVVIQQAAHDPCPSKKETLRDGKLMINLIKKYGKKVYVLIPWSKENDHEGHLKIQDIYESLMNECNIEGIDCGSMIQIIHPLIPLYQKDHEHLNALGSYVEACMILYTIFDQKEFKDLTIDTSQSQHFYTYQVSHDLSQKIKEVLNNREEK